MTLSEELREKRQSLASFIKLPSSINREYHIIMLELEILKLKSMILVESSKLTMDIFKSYMDTGFMQVNLDNGDIIQGNPTKTDDLISNVWNVRTEAEYLANVVYEKINR